MGAGARKMMRTNGHHHSLSCKRNATFQYSRKASIKKKMLLTFGKRYELPRKKYILQIVIPGLKEDVLDDIKILQFTLPPLICSSAQTTIF